MPNQAGEIEEALDKLASVLGFVRGHSTQNEFWISAVISAAGNGSILQQLKFLCDDVCALQSTCYNLQRKVLQLKEDVKGKRDR